jgi:hypothetical protein
MSTLSARLNEVKNSNTVKMYSVEGAKFQEVAINMLDRKGSAAHLMIGALVTAINNNQISVEDATSRFIAALEN